MLLQYRTHFYFINHIYHVFWIMGIISIHSNNNISFFTDLFSKLSLLVSSSPRLNYDLSKWHTFLNRFINSEVLSLLHHCRYNLVIKFSAFNTLSISGISVKRFFFVVVAEQIFSLILQF